MAQKTPPKAKTADARARAQARREALARAERRRRMGFLGIGGVVALVVILVITFIVVNNHDVKTAGTDVTAPASAAIVSDVTQIPASTYTSVGTAGVGKRVLGLSTVGGGTPITTNGLPTFVYVGAEFCPYCAAERWAMTAALSRFGTFTGLDTTRSAADDGNYATLSYLDAKYTSKYVAFSGTEQEDRARNLIKNPPAAENAAFNKYGKDAQGDLGYPFISLDNKYLSPYQYDPSELGTMTAAQIAAAVHNPISQLGKDVIASANVLTAGICAIDGQQPSAVCNAPEVKAAAAYLNTSSGSSGSSAG